MECIDGKAKQQKQLVSPIRSYPHRLEPRLGARPEETEALVRRGRRRFHPRRFLRRSDPAYGFGHRAVRWPTPLPSGWFAVSRHFYRLGFSPTESPVDYDTCL